MNPNKIGLIAIAFSTVSVFGQVTVESLHYRSRIDNSVSYFDDNIAVHSGVLPMIKTKSNIGFEREKGQLLTYNQTSENNTLNKYGFIVYPLTDLRLGGEYQRNNMNNPKYDLGLGLGLDFSSKKWFATAKLLPYFSHGNYVADSVQQHFNMDLGTTRAIFGNLFQRNEILLAFRPNPIFSFVGGYGKNFFGEGYRSLLLSDNASNYPFFKIETSFASIKYVNLYTIWNDNSINPSNKSLDRMKFSAMHYLSWNISREFNLSIFETVIWQQKDSIANRGFDLNYLNPIVFYRPVEYSTGSADNVLLGMNLTYKITKNHCIYTQLILDEFLLSRIKDDSKWWGNKWGVQLGYKSNNFVLNRLFFQIEFNAVRPFTYSHKYSTQNYGHLNASVTHPIGANFYEVLNIISFNKNKHRFTHKFTMAFFGVDTDSINNGQNIFNSYSDRKGEIGHLIMQGLRTNILNEQLIFETPLLEKINLFIHISYNYRMHYTPQQISHQHFLMIGIHSRIWNSYSDI